ncbi:hypothetical protein [Rhodopila sp.]|uniref:hypothetical protein n=1 Tax=Rhodopila sp. TaxID=2480087 RepID=UPI003D146D84
MTQPYDQGLIDGMGAASMMLDVSEQDIRLAAGELTPDEMRAVKAVLAWRKAMIRLKAGLE